MIGYYISLALRSLRSTPILSALMVAAIAVGVGASMTVLTLNYMMSQNALEHKDDVLFAVQLDSWDVNKAYDNANEVPWQLTYKDAQALLRSDIPTRQVAMHRYGFTVELEDSAIRPYTADIRVTTRDFFRLFDVPFIYGGTWEKSADNSPMQVVVLSKATNEKIFSGENSVGKTVVLNSQPFTVIGVIDTWEPSPKVYDVNNSSFAEVESLFVPFGLHRKLEIYSWGNTNGWDSGGEGEGYEGFLQSESVWIQFWVELSDSEQKAEYESFLTAYIQGQKEQGRFERPSKFALSKPSEWLVLNEVLSDDNRVLGWVSLAFLLVCVINAVALLLAKFLRKAPEAGVRRALGASRNAIFTQHLIESSTIGILGGIVGILLAFMGISGIRYLAMGQLDTVARMDWMMVIAAIGLALIASLLAGLYPAWRISRTNPSIYLKTQ
ncbi:ABC transporter permease [Microbulbifer sp. THAF38]|uniref:ABC transporter permease n=1 Tax=Microbulbifer sp. THAF38 TaxID=2587856 RepID=UPI0012685A2C|nr:ABC transporter permease [Microbulbifer sp. THAF38]QFT53703.1 Macrolide export ATP-binding/permease protein MacB [Microbulbifer sp. THAF38]